MAKLTERESPVKPERLTSRKLGVWLIVAATFVTASSFAIVRDRDEQPFFSQSLSHEFSNFRVVFDK